MGDSIQTSCYWVNGGNGVHRAPSRRCFTDTCYDPGTSLAVQPGTLPCRVVDSRFR